MANRNITLSLPAELIRQAKIRAAERDTIINGRIRKLMEEEYVDSSGIVLSTQVVQEFYAAGSRKMGIPRPVLTQIVNEFLRLPLIVIGPPHIRSAMESAERHQISFWDALILAAAQSAGATVLYTEGLNHGQRYGEVLVRNPFREP